MRLEFLSSLFIFIYFDIIIDIETGITHEKNVYHSDFNQFIITCRLC